MPTCIREWQLQCIAYDKMTSSLHHLLGLFSPSDAAASPPLSTTCADDVAFFFVLC